MKHIIPSALLLALAGTAFNASAQSAQINITGTFTPGACEVTLTGGDTIDFKTTLSDQLNAATPTSLGAKSKNVTIACDTLRTFALKVIDQRAATANDAVGSVAGGVGASAVFGLGTDEGGNKVGGYSQFLKTSLDQNNAALVQLYKQSETDSDWATESGHGDGTHLANNSLVAFARSGSTVPAAFTTVNTTINPHVAISPADDLDVTTDINLDGQTTLELVYL